MTIDEIIGRRIRTFRKSLNISRFDFCDKAQISSRFLTDVETGKSGISAETLYNLCLGTGVSADYILFGTSHNTTDTPLDELIKQIPPQYTLVHEDMIRSLLDAINISKSNKEDI